MGFTKRDDRLDGVFRALAHPIRRRLIERLRHGPATVGELAEPFDVSLMAISKHLDTLARSGLIRRTAEGRYRRCHLRPERLADATEWLDRQALFWTGTLRSLGEHLESEKADTRSRRSSR